MTIIQSAFDDVTPGFQSRVALITPEIAKTILTNNTGNRRLRPGMAERWAKIIRDGQWKLSPQGIVIGKTGRLLDGQHRLTAIILAGIPVMMNVVENVDEDIFDVLDRGAPRSVADALERDKRHVEVAGFITRQIVRRSSAVTDHNVAAILKEFDPEIAELHDFCSSTTRTFSAVPFRTAAVLRMVEGNSASYAKNTYRNMVLGKITELDSAPASLFSAVARNQVSTANREDLLFRAWRAFDKSKASVSKIAIKSPESVRAEIITVIRDRLGEDLLKKLAN